MVSSIPQCIQSAELSDENLSIKSKSVEVDDENRRIRFVGKVEVNFKHYQLKTHEVLINFVIVDGAKKIDQAIIPRSLILIDLDNYNNLVTGGRAQYSRTSQSLEVMDNVEVRRNNNVVLVDSLIVNLLKSR
jgi:lipopolysaccharide export system protein LptA